MAHKEKKRTGKLYTELTFKHRVSGTSRQTFPHPLTLFSAVKTRLRKPSLPLPQSKGIAFRQRASTFSAECLGAFSQKGRGFLQHPSSPTPDRLHRALFSPYPPPPQRLSRWQRKATFADYTL